MLMVLMQLVCNFFDKYMNFLCNPMLLFALIRRYVMLCCVVHISEKGPPLPIFLSFYAINSFNFNYKLSI